MTVDAFTISGHLLLAGSNDQIRADVAEVRRLEEEGLFCFADEAKCFSFGGA